MPQIPNIDVSLYPGLRSSANPRVSTRAGLVDGARPGGGNGGGEPDPDPEGIIFQENFDAQPDWNGAINSNDEQYASAGDVIPDGWDAARSTPGWSPSNGHPEGFESVYIKGGFEFARGGSGKAFVAYRFGRPSSAWWGDSILAKTFEGKTKLFVRFWIKFQPGWTRQGMTKLFRIQSWNARNNSELWNSPNIRPAFLWLFEHSSGGTRNTLGLRNNPDHTSWPSSFTGTLPRSMVNGDLPLHYINDAPGSVTFPDLVNGGNITGNPDHHQLFGDVWHKMEFYVEMNSAPGVHDGVLMQWMDDQLLFDNKQIPWMLESSPPGRTWDVLKLGGNDSWNRDDSGNEFISSDRASEWYAIDDLEVYDELPEDKA